MPRARRHRGPSSCNRPWGSRVSWPAGITRWCRRHRTQSATSRKTAATTPTEIRDASTSRSSSFCLAQNQALLACRPAYIPMPVPIVLTRKAANVPATAPMDHPIHPPIIAPESARTLDMCVGVVGSSGMDWQVGARRRAGWSAAMQRIARRGCPGALEGRLSAPAGYR